MWTLSGLFSSLTSHLLCPQTQNLLTAPGPSGLIPPFTEEPSLTTPFKRHPPIYSVALFMVQTTYWICLSLPGFHLHLMLHPCHHRTCGHEALCTAVCLMSTHTECSGQRVKQNLLFWSHAYRVRSYVTITLFETHPKLYSYNFIL